MPAISNVGHTPLRIEDISTTGEQAAAFALDRRGLPAILQPGNGGILRITVTPENPLPPAATLRIRSNDAVISTGTATGNITLVKLSASARDPHGDELTVTPVAWPAGSHGTLTLRSHTIRFVLHKPSIPGTIIFQVTIADTRGATVTADATGLIRHIDPSPSVPSACCRIAILDEMAVKGL